MIVDIDANATYAPSQELRGVIAASWDRLGNPSSLHRSGQRAKAAIEGAREVIRAMVGAGQKDRIIFTSSASEANNWVIRAAAAQGGELVSTTIEHPCVLQPLRAIQGDGGIIQLVAPLGTGEISPELFLKYVSDKTSFVSCIAANNETGVVNDIFSIATQVRWYAPHALIHTDAAQLIGKGQISFSDIGVDCLTLSGHKIGGLSGVGALVIREGIEINPLILGGTQESKLRGGTENVLGIISFGAAAGIVNATLSQRINAMRAIRDRFEQEIARAPIECEINGQTARRLPNTSNIWFKGVRADDLLVALDLEGVLVSSGAACSSGKPEPSHVLTAMGQDENRARQSIRFSFRGDQDPELATYVVDKLARIIGRMRLD